MALQIAPSLPPAAPPPAGSAAPADTDEDSGFARLLQGQSEARAAARNESPDSGTDPSSEADAATAAERARQRPVSDDEPDQAAAVDPSLAHWLAGLHLPLAPEAKLPAAATGAAGACADDGAVASTGRGGSRLLALRGQPDRGNEPRGAATAKNGPQADADAAALQAQTREAREAPAASPTAANEAGGRPAAADPGSAGAPVGSAPSAAWTPGPATHVAAAAPASGTPVDVPLATGPMDSDFGATFSTQVSVLARDGVQQAELHLNPAETGPVSVQIVLEGTHARIEFGADALPTRQAIEGSLPELAAALREQGLTLSGGGVSEHARGRHEPPAEPGGRGTAARGSVAAESAGGPVRSVRVGRSAGGLDLYA